MGGGIDAIVYAGIQVFPNFAKWVSGFAQIVFLSGHFGATLASIGDYLLAAVARFTDVPASQEELFEWCFWYTSPSIFGPILFFVLSWLIIGLAWALFVMGVSAVWDVLVSSPFPYMFGGAFTDNTAYEAMFGDQAYVEMEPQTTTDPQGITRRVFMPVRKPRGQASLIFSSLDTLYARLWNRVHAQYR